MTDRAILDIPAMEASRELRAPQVAAPDSLHPFRYEHPDNESLPHVVKFSGGRTSGMLLLLLLEASLLKAERGDVVVFNNTSAEHPKTYEFARRCKEFAERKHGLPFFWLEYQTYEDARGGEYTRLPSWRLVNAEPRSESNPEGYHWRGEVYEELLSWTGFVPNLFQRTCTQSLKLETTRAFLKEWFADRPGTERLGHFGKASRLEDDELYERHLRSGGGVPREIFLEKKRFARERPFHRPAQLYADFSSPARGFQSSYLAESVPGESVVFGEEGVEYLSFVGLRGDEPHRVARVRRRNGGGPESAGYRGERARMPLFDRGVTREDVEDFWRRRSWNLDLDSEAGLSNCAFCFLKGVGALQNARAALGAEAVEELRDTPCDLNWWVALERKYGRDLKAEKRTTAREIPDDFIGFFGASSGFSYRRLAEAPMTKGALAEFAESVLPCDCTD